MRQYMIRYNTIRCDLIQYDMIYDMIRFNTIQYDTKQCEYVIRYYPVVNLPQTGNTEHI